MNNVTSENIIEEVTKFYLSSHDFNGISLSALADKLKITIGEICESICRLIAEDLVGVLFSDSDVNPNIIRIGFEKKENQIEKLKQKTPPTAFIYPRPKHLNKVVDEKQYQGNPYRLCLALGEPQLAYRSFDLQVLEFYRNDPRYSYDNNDVGGKIYCNSDEMQNSDRVFLQTFGFSYDANFNRAVAVFLRYLSNLSSEHQQIWKAKELKGDFKLHPDYYRVSIIGDWPDRIPICSAFLKELFIINQMANAMGRPKFFLQDFGEYGDNKPQRFGFLIRTTLEEFNHFVLLLDKMLSDNINKKFFKNEVPYENEIKRKDGKIEIQNKGTLQILDEWIRKYFNTEDWGLWDKSIKSLRKIRKLRQKPAHEIDENIFDQRYFKEQRELIIEAYSAIKILRLLFANHPMVDAADIKMPTWLEEGQIWTQ